jgi:hypothetical protein
MLIEAKCCYPGMQSAAWMKPPVIAGGLFVAARRSIMAIQVFARIIMTAHWILVNVFSRVYRIAIPVVMNFRLKFAGFINCLLATNRPCEK